jgi:hypothetical protein
MKEGSEKVFGSWLQRPAYLQAAAQRQDADHHAELGCHLRAGVC